MCSEMEETARAAASENGSLVFAVNGERFQVQKIHPSTTLLEFMRNHTRFKSAKLSCGQGIYIYIYIYHYLFEFGT